MTNTLDTRTRYRIVVGFDFSPQAMMALQYAIRMGTEVHNSEVHIVSVLGDSVNSTFPRVEQSYTGADEIRARVREITDAELDKATPARLTVFVHARIGKTAPTILQVAAEVAADLLVIGTHSKTRLARWVLGSVSEQLLRRASCPVVVMRETDYESDWSLEHLPEPPCPRCLERRQQTSGYDWWCDQHGDGDVPYERPIFGVYERDPSRRLQNAWVLY